MLSTSNSFQLPSAARATLLAWAGAAVTAAAAASATAISCLFIRFTPVSFEARLR